MRISALALSSLLLGGPAVHAEEQSKRYDVVVLGRMLNECIGRRADSEIRLMQLEDENKVLHEEVDKLKGRPQE